MPIDDSGIFRGLARFIAWIAVDFVYEVGFQMVCIWTGRLVLLVLTLGRFPNSRQAEDYEVLIGIFGLILILGTGFIAFEYLSATS